MPKSLLNKITTSFARHETFTVRYGWLKKGYDFVQHGLNFADDDAPVELGVGKNMVKSIAYWCEAYGIIEKNEDKWKTTDFANELLGKYDPHLEDPASLWLLHYMLATNEEKATTIYWAFNHCTLHEFNVDHFCSDLKFHYSNLGSNVNENSILKDFQIFKNTYISDRLSCPTEEFNQIECPFIYLDLLSATAQQGIYRFNIGAKDSLPIEWIAMAVAEQMNDHLELSYEQLLYGCRSPGVIFKLNSESLYEALNLITKDKLLPDWIYTEDAGVNVLRKPKDSNPKKLELLKRYYGKNS